MKKLILFLGFFLIIQYGLYINNCPAQWVQTSGPSGGTTLCFTGLGAGLFAGTFSDGVSVTTNNGNNWTVVNNGISGLGINALAVSGSSIFAGSGENGVFRSTNNGANWIAVNNGLTNLVVFALAVSGSNIFAGVQGNGVFISTNNGDNWLATGLTGGTVSSLAVSGSSVFAGIETGPGNVSVSTNNGLNWSQVNIPGATQTVFCLAVSGSNIFAGTMGNGIFRTTNNGLNWTQVNNGLTNLYIFSFAVTATSIFTGTSNGVYYSSNFGNNWTAVNEGFSSSRIARSLFIFSNYIFAGISGQNCWRRMLFEIIGVKQTGTNIPEEYSLEQNYPNPFNSVTCIKFSVPGTLSRFYRGSGLGGGIVTLKVFDLLGKEVATLVNEKLQPGTYQVDFNADNLPSGIYFYRLKSDNFSETKRFILMK